MSPEERAKAVVRAWDDLAIWQLRQIIEGIKSRKDTTP